MTDPISGSDLATQNISGEIVQPSKLVALARGLMVQVLEDPIVRAGIAAAEGAKGIVIHDENERVALNDRALAVTKATKRLDAGKRGVLEIPKAMTAAVGDTEAQDRARLVEARAAFDDADRVWLRRQREAAEKAERERMAKVQAQARLEREQQAERDRIARENAEREQIAALEGTEAVLIAMDEVDEIPPPPEAPPIVAPPALVRTSAGASTSVKRLTCELVSVAECDPYWLVLRDVTTPIAAFKAVLARGDVREPGVGAENAIIYRGVKFYFNETISRSAR